MSFQEGRRCSICNAYISDDNPDGIGCTCRKVWEKAFRIGFYHFHGLEIWKKKSEYWVDIFIKTFENTKFRSSFRKSFYQSIKQQSDSGELRLSKKMFNIVRSAIIGEEEQFGRPPWKGDLDYELYIEGEKELVLKMKEEIWDRNGMSKEESDYVENLAKKFYSESRI
jgi:hypothetical protein